MKLLTWLRIAAPISLAAIALTIKLSPQYVQQFFARFEPNDPFVSEYYEVIPGSSIVTGDTLRVFDGHKETTVQLCGIDAPELGQSPGREARQSLQEMVSQGDGRIVLLPVTTENNGLLVAEAFIPLIDSEEELHLNSQLVSNGLVHVAKTVEFCPNANAILRAEGVAKAQALGLWAQPVSQNE